MNTVTLCMIVKNEEHIVERCLSSVYKHIDSYTICDTGSTDNTKKIITKFFKSKKIPGKIYDDKWVDFGHNRTLALEKCYGKCVWALMIDADDFVEGDLDLNNLDTQFDAYDVIIGNKNFSYNRTQIFNIINKRWRFEEPIHEYATCEGETRIKILDGNYTWHSCRDGDRSKTFSNTRQKYFSDYMLLKSYLLKDENQPRKQFYAAQSLFDAEVIDLAEREYLKRTLMDGWKDEIFYSWLKIGMCRELRSASENSIIEAYMNAYEIDNQRVEPLYLISYKLRKSGKNKSAFMYAYSGKDIAINNKKLFIHRDHYTWRIHDEIGSTAYYAGNKEAGRVACKKILDEPYLPKEHRQRVIDNSKFYI